MLSIRARARLRMSRRIYNTRKGRAYKRWSGKARRAFVFQYVGRRIRKRSEGVFRP